MKHYIWPTLCGILIMLLTIEQFNLVEKLSSKDAAPAANTLSFAQTIERAKPSVVNIYSLKLAEKQNNSLLDDPYLKPFLTTTGIGKRKKIARSLGSGVLINSGYILTNYHVVKDTEEIEISLSDGRNSIAKLVGIDQATDLAVLHSPLDNLNNIEVADSNTLNVGDIVMAIGNPFGFGHSVSLGIISATNRYGLNLSTYENYIQTDAAVNPGSSGGALIDINGRLIGINTALYSKDGGFQGISLATPSTLALNIMKDLIAYGEVIRGWIGIEAATQAENTLAEKMLLVSGFAKGSPAMTAGVQRLDLIESIDGLKVSDGHFISHYVAAKKPGENVTLGIIRNGEPLNINVILARIPK